MPNEESWMTRLLTWLVLACCLSSTIVYGQTTGSDSANKENDDTEQKVVELEPMEIIAHFNKQSVLGLTASAQSITAEQIEAQQTTTLLPALNAVPGIRMEQRSPGSYRLAMRGSLIRSPFGIRNVKMYMDEFSLTDAGGNTYLNLIDPASIDSIHVLKGPDGSLYGANSGGVIRIQPKGFDVFQNQGSLLLSAGSFGLQQEQFSVQRSLDNDYSFSFDQSLTRSDGYRDHSSLDKKTYQTAHKWRYSEHKELRLLALYSDLHYQTPGGLTEAQRQENPRMSRPATAFTPSAEEQQAGIYNKTFFAGVAHEARINDKLTHSISLFGSDTDFENPFITNYEFRQEQNLGMRTYFSYQDRVNDNIQWQMQFGFEGQKGWNDIVNYDNNQGKPAALQARDDLDNTQSSVFYRAMVNLYDRWTLEASLGLNQADMNYQSHFPETPDPDGDISFGSIFMPRVATSYRLSDSLAVRASVSKGFSPPTIAEVRSSDNTINTELEAETGINYEVGLRWETANRRFITDLSIYKYNMDNGIVRQLNEAGAEYFVNAAEIKQKGIEAAIWAYLLPSSYDGWIQSLRVQSAVSYNHYRFGHYQVNNNDYSGNHVTAVPDWVWSNTLSFVFPKQIGLNISHNFMSKIPLNDSNTVYSDKYHLLQMKGTWDLNISSSFDMQLFAGVDNVLNEEYSLGNDINAFGNRYFNPAPGRNYYGGVTIEF
ncbi:TonB-dependent receptor [Marinicella gelatinilytica]|uniref:TonB-dependent receptor n=1 Tax=Marinicella gelatinilytica TaxID=2996017 RepID=UPI002260A177|nr:TonB-dependent receptor [Marinicella gelatinilytica]MCX7546230.1 TonB-dependent receptor [Marinicella gelatinilytica]